MTKISRPQKILSEIEQFLEAGKNEDARVLLTFLDHGPFDRESRLRLLWINVALDGPAAYQDDISQLSAFSDLNSAEKDLIEKVSLLARKSADKGAHTDRLRADGSDPAFARSGTSLAVESELLEKTRLLQNREAELLASRNAVHALEQQIGATNEVLEKRNANLETVESEVTALTAQLNELGRAKDLEVGRLHEELVGKAEVLQAQESALTDAQNHFTEKIRAFEAHNDATRDLLAVRDAELDSLKATMGELIQKTEQMQFLETRLGETKRLLDGRNAELDSFKARIGELTRQAEEFPVLEAQLHETKSLLAARDAELDSCETTKNKLMRDKADLVSQRENADREMHKQLGEQTGLLRAMESSLAEMEAQTGEQIRLLERQVEEKQNLLQSSQAELSEMRNQICVLNQRAAEADAAKLHAETTLYEERRGTRQKFLATPSSDAEAPARRPEPIIAGASARRESGYPWFIRLVRVSLIDWQAKTWPRTALPVVAGLLLIPIGYFFLNQARTVSNPKASVTWEGTIETSGVTEEDGSSFTKTATDEQNRNESAGSVARPADLKTRKAALANNRNTGRRDDQPERVAGYVTRRTVALREQPRFAASAKTEIGPGTAVRVLDTQGNWLRVKTQQSGAIGYVRKEYLVYASSNR